MDALKIEILLREYDTLREEVMRRYDAQFQTIGMMAVVLVGLLAALAAGISGAIIAALVAGAFVVFIFLLLWADHDITKAAERLRELEGEINRRAGERLLRWETNAAGTIFRRLGKVPAIEYNTTPKLPAGNRIPISGAPQKSGD
jgi:hypothetical protein